MALPTAAQISGKHNALYESFYRSLDPEGTGVIPAAVCAKFLKKSALSDAILSKIWDLSDPAGKGHLDKAGLFVSLKLITEAQNGREVTATSILNDVSEEPMMGERDGTDISWLNVTLDDVSKFWKIFEGIVGPDGKVPGNKAKGIFLESGQSVDVLGKVWDLSDTDKDGALDLFEFSIAMYVLSMVAKKKLAVVPKVLPPEFLNNLKKLCNSYNVAPPPIAPPITHPTPPPPVVPIIKPVDSWSISAEDKSKFSALFDATDKDQDGFVSGGEIKDVFLQSGVNQQILAHIWNLCDTSQSGKLTLEQFTLAMWLLQRKIAGIEPPTVLPPELIPKAKDPDVNPEFELIMKEIMELAGEKSFLENEIFLKENDKKIKTGEMKSLQSEYDTLAATLRQLENQRNVANGKLAELQGQVTTLRTQAEEQETILITQELENSGKRGEVEKMVQEEESIEAEIKQVHRMTEELEAKIGDTQLEISKRKQHLVDVQELENNLRSSIIKYDSAMESGNVYSVTEPELRDLSNDFEEILNVLNDILGVARRPVSVCPSVTSPFIERQDSFPVDFSGGDNTFEFKVQQPAPVADTFDDPFAALHAPTAANVASWDAMHEAKPVDPFAPVANPEIKDYSPGKDPFGHEPFSAAPGPALPPKGQGAKKPPPRPAPPKNAPARPPPPAMKKPEEDSFADFSVFEQTTSSPWGQPALPSKARLQPQQQQQQPEKLDFTEDPFKNYRYEDPFALSIDPFANSSSHNDPFK